MTHGDDLMTQIRNAVVGHDVRGRAILALPDDAAPIVMDAPGMMLSSYGLGGPLEGCECQYCQKRRILWSIYNPPGTNGEHDASPSEA